MKGKKGRKEKEMKGKKGKKEKDRKGQKRKGKERRRIKEVEDCGIDLLLVAGGVLRVTTQAYKTSPASSPSLKQRR